MLQGSKGTASFSSHVDTRNSRDFRCAMIDFVIGGVGYTI
jgi:hypothetical protein